MVASPARNALCPCGSGSKYKRCCGAADRSATAKPVTADTLSSRATRLMKARAPDDWDCAGLLRALARADAEPLRVVNPDTGERDERDSMRVCEGVLLGPLRPRVIELVNRAYRDLVEPNYGVQIEWFEEPQVLRYRPGGYYRAHADRDFWDEREQRWRQYMDRDLSLLIYLDDGFEGGELAFPYADFTLRPEPGLVVAFPSDHRFLHEARPITHGIRHAVVSWAAAFGGPRVGRPGSDTLHPIQR